MTDPAEYVLEDHSTSLTPQTRHNCPAFVTFANEISYFLDYSGQGYGFIHKDEGWRCDINYTLADILTGYAMRPCCLEVTEEGLDRLYQTLGYPSRRVFSADPVRGTYADEADMKRIIRHALCTLGQPVIVNPIEGRFFGALVVGYRRDGDVLVTFGYPPYFMAPDNTLPQVMDIENWYQADTVLTVPGKRAAAPSPRAVYAQGLRQVYAYLAAGIRGEDRPFYDEWEAFLRMDMADMVEQVRQTRVVPGARMFRQPLEENVPEEKVRAYLHVLADPTWCEMAERRYYIMHFFHQAALHFPEVKEAMGQIMHHFGRSNGIMGEEYIRQVGHDPVNAERFADPACRGHMADCVAQFREADAQGLSMVESLVARMGILA